MELDSRPVVFLDRDGTINVDSGYVCTPEELVVLPGIPEALAQLRRAGYALVVVSNQSAVGRGMASMADVQRTNEALQAMLVAAQGDAVIDLWCVAPDHPERASDLRKPQTGMLRAVREKFTLPMQRCWMIGDKLSDIGFGLNAGIPPNRCVLLAPERPTTAKPEDEAFLETGYVLAESVVAVLPRIIAST